MIILLKIKLLRKSKHDFSQPTLIIKYCDIFPVYLFRNHIYKRQPLDKEIYYIIKYFAAIFTVDPVIFNSMIDENVGISITQIV